MTVAAAMAWAAFANAQVSGAENELETDEPDARAATDAEAPSEIPEELFESRVMDEIIVIAGPQGQTPFELELERQELMKDRIYAEVRLREREQEELAWRQADPDLKNPESRFKWGYSPQAEQRMRRGNDFMYDMPAGGVKPATIFRAEF
jgi:hypothetical protein